MLQFLSFIPNLLGMANDYFEGKRKLKQAKVESELRVTEAVTTSNIDLAKAGKMHDIDWSITQAKASTTSWKDEYWTIVVSIPAIMSFVPGMSPYVVQGFDALSHTPEWYQQVLLIAIGAAFGVVAWKKLKGMKDG
jgi:hypothetical protein